MSNRRSFLLVAAGCAALMAGTGSYAQDSAGDYPNRPVHIVVPFGAGTTTDQVARFIAQRLSEETKQTFIVDNKPGANGAIALRYAIAQPADGYTFVLGTNTTHAANLSLFKTLNYDPVKDFIPICNLIIGGVILGVAADGPIKSVPDLIDRARKNPGKITFGSGNSSSLAGGVVMRELTGIDIVNVPYKTLPAAMTDLIGGQIDTVFGDAPAVMPSVRSGKVRALGISTKERVPAFPEIPTFIEQGVAGYEVTGWIAAFGLRGTPPAIVSKLNAMMARAIASQDAANIFGGNGWVSIPGSPEELGIFQRQEIERWAKLVKAGGIEPE